MALIFSHNCYGKMWHIFSIQNDVGLTPVSKFQNPVIKPVLPSFPWFNYENSIADFKC